MYVCTHAGFELSLSLSPRLRVCVNMCSCFCLAGVLTGILKQAGGWTAIRTPYDMSAPHFVQFTRVYHALREEAAKGSSLSCGPSVVTDADWEMS